MNLKEFIESQVELSKETWLAFSSIFSEMELNKDEYFIKEGEKATKMVFLESGMIRSYFTTEKGEEYTYQFYRNPSFVTSLSSIFMNDVSRLNFQAITDCKLMICCFEELEDLYLKYPKLMLGVIQFYRRFVIQTEQRIFELLTMEANERYVLFQKHFPDLENNIPQYKIASYLGISATQLSRIRKNQKK